MKPPRRFLLLLFCLRVCYVRPAIGGLCHSSLPLPAHCIDYGHLKPLLLVSTVQLRYCNFGQRAHPWLRSRYVCVIPAVTCVIPAVMLCKGLKGRFAPRSAHAFQHALRVVGHYPGSCLLLAAPRGARSALFREQYATTRRDSREPDFPSNNMLVMPKIVLQ